MLTTVQPGAGAAAFAAAFDDVYTDCVRLAWHMTGNRDDAEDIAADVLASAWRRVEHGEIADPRRYLLRAVSNRARSWLRRRYVRVKAGRVRSGDDRGVRWHPDDVTDRDQMWTALARLPDRQRITLVLRYYEGLSVDETAQVMGVSGGTVKSNTSRGLARLEELLTAQGAQP